MLTTFTASTAVESAMILPWMTFDDGTCALTIVANKIKKEVDFINSHS
jgi:hypothetical protein